MGRLVVGHTTATDGLLVADPFYRAQTVVVGPGEQTINASGFAQAVAFGTAKVNQTIACVGAEQPVAFGTAKLNQTVGASGFAQTVTFGTTRINLTIAAVGFAQTVTFGGGTIENAPLLPQTITANSVAQPVTFGTASLSGYRKPAAGGDGSQRPRRMPLDVTPDMLEDEEELLVLALGHALAEF